MSLNEASKTHQKKTIFDLTQNKYSLILLDNRLIITTKKSK